MIPSSRIKYILEVFDHQRSRLERRINGHDENFSSFRDPFVVHDGARYVKDVFNRTTVVLLTFFRGTVSGKPLDWALDEGMAYSFQIATAYPP